MQTVYAELVSRIKTTLASSPHERILVAVAGPPGSGKTTTATYLVDLLNKEVSRCGDTRDERAQPYAISVSIDGFHYTREYLDSLPNREEAYVRRGAPWTFDVEEILKFIKSLQDSSKLSVDARLVMKAPSFDHAMKDPVEDDIKIGSATSVIILEGNYLLLDEEEWRDISQLVDVKVFVEVDVDCARDRVAQRHVNAGIEQTYQAALVRFDSNDALNGSLIREKLMPYHVRIESC